MECDDLITVQVFDDEEAARLSFENPEQVPTRHSNQGPENIPVKGTKGSRLNGYHLFYKGSSSTIVKDSSQKRTTPPTLGEMSKIGGRNWKKLQPEARKEWIQKGREERERRREQGVTKFKCGKCEKTFNGEKYMHHHENSCGEAICFIDNCGKKFTSTILLKKHQKTHDKTYECAECGKSFSTKQILKVHMISHTEGIPCALCGRHFTNQSNLTRHTKTIHHSR
eukprot:TCONS_00035393-protein